MAKAKVETNPEVVENVVLETLPEEIVEQVVEVSKPDSAAKAAYRALIETYAKQNPAKFAEKKAALFARLETL